MKRSSRHVVWNVGKTWNIATLGEEGAAKGSLMCCMLAWGTEGDGGQDCKGLLPTLKISIWSVCSSKTLTNLSFKIFWKTHHGLRCNNLSKRGLSISLMVGKWKSCMLMLGQISVSKTLKFCIVSCLWKLRCIVPSMGLWVAQIFPQ